MIVSLDDQLEWQENVRSHSPRTPTAPEVLQSLRLNSPPPNTSRGNHLLQSPKALSELYALTGVEALDKLTRDGNLRTAVVRADYLCFRDGTALALSLPVPLTVRTLDRKEDGDNSVRSESTLPLTLGSAWLSGVAEYIYESQMASLLRSRKNLSEIVMDDRRVLNRYLHGKLSLTGLMASGLWASPVDEITRMKGDAELSVECDDVLSNRIRRKTQSELLEERKATLHDQQNRLRRLLARELQRMHSAKAANVAVAAPTASPPSVGNPDVSSAVANLLKRFKPKAAAPGVAVSATPVPEVGHAPSGVPRNSADLAGLEAKLKSLHVEWYRVGHRLRNAVECQTVLERKIKRLRYVPRIFYVNPMCCRVDECELLKGI